MTRRTVLIGLAVLALAAPSGVALASPPTNPAPCAQGEITSFAVQQVVDMPVGPDRIHLHLEGWTGPCAGAPLPAGYRYQPYYHSGTVGYLADNPEPFGSTTQPTPFDVGISVPVTPGPLADPLVAVCLAYTNIWMMSCIAPDGVDANGLPVFVPVPTSYVREHVRIWPPLRVILAQPDPTCGTCV